MNITNKWKEYNAETLVPPCVVQHDTVGKEHLVWVWTGENIVQVSRLKYDEKSILTDVMTVSEKSIVTTDPKDTIISELQAQVKTLQAEKVVLLEEKATWITNPIIKEVIK